MGKLEDLLDENPSFKLLSKGKLKKKLELEHISKEEIDAYLNPKELYQIYAKPKKYKPLKITSDPYSFQCDISFLPAFKDDNDGIEAFFIIVDILSRKAWAYPLKSRKMKDILNAYQKFLSDSGLLDEVNSIAGDNEFNKTEFVEFNKQLHIKTYFNIAKDDHIIQGKGDVLGIVDRCIRTIKQYIQKKMVSDDDFEWTRYLDEIIDLYNNTTHQGLKDMTPNEVFLDYDYMVGLSKGQKKYNKDVNETFDLKQNDKVRAIVGKEKFQKEKANFSKEIYTIVKQVGYKFEIQGEDGKILSRKYRPSELLKIGEVKERLTSSKKEDEEDKHKKVVRTRKALEHGKSYKEVKELIENKEEPKVARIKKKVVKLDL